MIEIFIMVLPLYIIIILYKIPLYSVIYYHERTKKIKAVDLIKFLVNKGVKILFYSLNNFKFHKNLRYISALKCTYMLNESVSLSA